MTFRITGLSPEPFRRFYGLSDEELAPHGGERYLADDPRGALWRRLPYR